MKTIHQKIEDKMLKRLDKLLKKTPLRTRAEFVRILLDEALTMREAK